MQNVMYANVIHSSVLLENPGEKHSDTMLPPGYTYTQPGLDFGLCITLISLCESRCPI